MLFRSFDVFSHAVEAYTSKVAFPMSDILAEKAIELVVKNLPIAYKDGGNIEAREGLALADTYAGISLNNAVVSLAHVLAHAIPAKYHDIAHGDALYSVYAEVLKLNCKGLVEKHEFIADQLEKGNKDVVSAFDKFFSQFNFENKFKSKNPDENAINTIAEAAFTYMKGVTDLNPVEVNVEDVRMILKNSIA